MKPKSKSLLPTLAVAGGLALVSITCSADTLVLQSRSVTGTVLQTNGDNVLMMTDYGTLNYSLAIIKEIKIDRAEAADFTPSGRLPDFRSLVVFLSREPWTQGLKQIPATVIDKGILRNVPYSSYRCVDDYEINIYGDPNDPAGIEAGVSGKLLNDQQARHNCISLVRAVLGRSADKNMLDGLKLEQDLKTDDGFTFEITPPTVEDAYGGWWVSVYSEQKLSLSRASEAELKNISVTKADVVRASDGAGWSVEDLKLARRPELNLISFTTEDGQFIQDAEVVRVNDGVSVIWKKGASGGTVKLARLSENLRRRFGYDPTKAAHAEEVEKARRAQSQTSYDTYSPSYDSSSLSGSSGGGRVYVHSYTRSDGTYVSGYTRRR
jgi:hypothetical protein